MKKLVMLLLAIAMFMIVGCGKTSSDTKSALTAGVDANVFTSEEKVMVNSYFEKWKTLYSKAFEDKEMILDDFKLITNDKVVIITAQIKVSNDSFLVLKEVINKEKEMFIQSVFVGEELVGEKSYSYIEALCMLPVAPNQDFTVMEISKIEEASGEVNIDKTNSKQIKIEFVEQMNVDNENVDVNVKLLIVKRNNKVYMNVYFENEFVTSNEFNSVDEMLENDSEEELSEDLVMNKNQIIEKMNIWK